MTMPGVLSITLACAMAGGYAQSQSTDIAASRNKVAPKGCFYVQQPDTFLSKITPCQEFTRSVTVATPPTTLGDSPSISFRSISDQYLAMSPRPSLFQSTRLFRQEPALQCGTISGVEGGDIP